MRIRLTGQGEVGPGGGPAGDLYVEIHVAQHATFRRHGNDLHATVSVPMTAAALGTVLTLPTLESDLGDEGQQTFDLDVAAGTQSGSTVTLRGLGVPGLRTQARGDLVVTIVVETPTKLDARQEELLRELARLRGEEAVEGSLRPAHKSVFNRLRDAFSQH
jgi:molecular chaperone DnaJ